MSYDKFGGGGRDRTGVYGFAGRCITTLLPRQGHHSNIEQGKQLRTKKGSTASLSEFGAGKESRTLDLNLGKVALYQLSYSRIALLNLPRCRENGAGKESRTLDLNLGKVALYQLSYSRVDNRRTLYSTHQSCQEL